MRLPNYLVSSSSSCLPAWFCRCRFLFSILLSFGATSSQSPNLYYKCFEQWKQILLAMLRFNFGGKSSYNLTKPLFTPSGVYK
jgi:hypothetical protein